MKAPGTYTNRTRLQAIGDCISGRGGCNRYSGALSGTPAALHITQLATTRAACPPPVMDQETRFLINLAKSTRLAVEGDHLVLSDADGTALLRFHRLPDAPVP